MTRSRGVPPLEGEYIRGEPQFANRDERSAWPYQDDLNSMIQWMRETILDNFAFREPSQQEALRPENLVLRAGTPRLRNALNMLLPDGSNLIVFGEGLYALLRAFVKTVATNVVPSVQDGNKPSEEWPAARDAMARMFDQFSTPFAAFDEPDIALGSTQQRFADVYTGYAVRFVLCHEMSHVLCGHLRSADVAAARIGARDFDILRAKQEAEMEADAVGLELQAGSMPNHEMRAGAIGSAMYFISVVYLLTFRLDLLSGLVDDLQAWEITEVPLDHPPVLARVMTILSKAERFEPGISPALDQMRLNLFDVVHQVVEAAREHQQIAISATADVLRNAAGSPRDDVRSAIDAHFASSRSGVLVALKREILNGSHFAASLVRETLPEARDFFERYSPGLL